MNVVITEENGLLAKVEGRIDSTNSKDFEIKIEVLFANADKQILINLVDLTYVSSSGLRVFLMLQKAVIANGGKLVLSNLTPAVREVFNITGFSSVFTIE